MKIINKLKALNEGVESNNINYLILSCIELSADYIKYSCLLNVPMDNTRTKDEDKELNMELKLNIYNLRDVLLAINREIDLYNKREYITKIERLFPEKQILDNTFLSQFSMNLVKEIFIRRI